ncbi:hypothetical protein GO988_12395 [Hymenobacter sp. HMF4947]|uniref:Uncharacterized protein n=1 Tax=Hymenobacter ginkgonis TaxID=2682976 RepID=A0A7K1TFE7_9BACT|nr:hypothetical protein [Hymenobacter ginkgonis]MVN77127.1 hypothetical protein [Hymenobacter ginkgonis]
MKKLVNLDVLWVGCVVVATAIGWLLVRKGAVPNERAAVEKALRQATPADLESITLYPLVGSEGGAPARPFQARAPAQLRTLLPALQQLRPIAAATSAFQPLLEATLVVRLLAPPAEAWHLHSRNLIFRLASSNQGEVAQLARTNYFYQAAALNQRLRQLRDSLARR